jgi:hypothetical protein
MNSDKNLATSNSVDKSLKVLEKEDTYNKLSRDR